MKALIITSLFFLLSPIYAQETPKTNKFLKAKMEQKALVKKMDDLVSSCQSNGGVNCEATARASLLYEKQLKKCTENGSSHSDCEAKLAKFKPKK